jgi:hypothetical protein
VIETTDLTLNIQETFPLLVLNDNHYFIGAVLSNSAWENLKKAYKGKFSDLRNVRMRVKAF